MSCDPRGGPISDHLAQFFLVFVALVAMMSHYVSQEEHNRLTRQIHSFVGTTEGCMSDSVTDCGYLNDLHDKENEVVRWATEEENSRITRRTSLIVLITLVVFGLSLFLLQSRGYCAFTTDLLPLTLLSVTTVLATEWIFTHLISNEYTSLNLQKIRTSAATWLLAHKQTGQTTRSGTCQYLS